MTEEVEDGTGDVEVEVEVEVEESFLDRQGVEDKGENEV